jgi:hypothetical protein
MALYHLSVQTVSRKDGRSAKDKAEYNQREGRFAKMKDPCLFKQSTNMPEWAQESPTLYWEGADLYERGIEQGKGRLYKEVEISLPVELDFDERKSLAQRFVEFLTGKERLPCTLAIHAGHGRNPHAHIMISERKNDGIERPRDQWFKQFYRKDPSRSGAEKSRSLMPKAWLETVRKTWAEFANRALQGKGRSERIDHRSLAAQGIDRVPQVHLGPNVLRMEVRGIERDRADRALEVEKLNAQIIDLGKIRDALAIERRREGVDAGATPPERVVGKERGTEDERDSNDSPDRSRERHADRIEAGTTAKHGVRNVRTRELVPHGGESELLLSSDARDHLRQNEGTERAGGVRREVLRAEVAQIGSSPESAQLQPAEQGVDSNRTGVSTRVGEVEARELAQGRSEADRAAAAAATPAVVTGAARTLDGLREGRGLDGLSLADRELGASVAARGGDAEASSEKPSTRAAVGGIGSPPPWVEERRLKPLSGVPVLRIGTGPASAQRSAKQLEAPTDSSGAAAPMARDGGGESRELAQGPTEVSRAVGAAPPAVVTGAARTLDGLREGRGLDGLSMEGRELGASVAARGGDAEASSEKPSTRAAVGGIGSPPPWVEERRLKPLSGVPVLRIGTGPASTGLHGAEQAAISADTGSARTIGGEARDLARSSTKAERGAIAAAPPAVVTGAARTLEDLHGARGLDGLSIEGRELGASVAARGGGELATAEAPGRAAVGGIGSPPPRAAGRQLRPLSGVPVLSVQDRAQEVRVNERDRADSRSEERAGAGGTDRAAGAESGGALGPERERARGVAGRGGPAARGVELGSGGGAGAAAATGAGSAADRGAESRGEQRDRERGAATTLGAVGGDGERDRYSSSLERIHALAASARSRGGAAGAGRGGGGGAMGRDEHEGAGGAAAAPRVAAVGGDRTGRAVTRQLEAMGCEQYEVGILERRTGKIMNRTWSGEEIQERLAWLKRMNARGNDVYIRPARGDRASLVLVDDLDRRRLDQMARDGATAAVVVETSPGNFQAWVRLPDRTAEAVHREVARELAHRYEGDPASAAALHYGRLAGFTNQKEQYRGAGGLQPWALLREAGGREARAATELVQGAEERLTGSERASGETERSALRPRVQGRDPIALYREAMGILLPQAPRTKEGGPDRSWCDFRAAGLLVREGYSREEVADAIRTASPDLEERKRGHVEDYVERTVDAVLRSSRARSSPVRGRDEGPER